MILVQVIYISKELWVLNTDTIKKSVEIISAEKFNGWMQNIDKSAEQQENL